MVRNKFAYKFDKEKGDMAIARRKLRKFFARHIQDLYELFDKNDIYFPDFEGWPRGFDLEKVESGDFTELDADLARYEALAAAEEEEYLNDKDTPKDGVAEQ